MVKIIFLNTVLRLIHKNVVLEFKTKNTILSMLVFSLMVVSIYGFAFNLSQQVLEQIFPGILWVTVTFTCVLGFDRSIAQELENDALYGLLVLPVDRSCVLYSRVLSNLLFVLIVETVSIPLFFVLLGYKMKGSMIHLLLIIVLGTYGMVSIGSFLSFISVNAKNSYLLLFVLYFPVVIPLIISCVKLTCLVLSGNFLAPGNIWVKVLVFYNIVFTILPSMLFEYIVEG